MRVNVKKVHLVLSRTFTSGPNALLSFNSLLNNSRKTLGMTSANFTCQSRGTLVLADGKCENAFKRLVRIKEKRNERKERSE